MKPAPSSQATSEREKNVKTRHQKIDKVDKKHRINGEKIVNGAPTERDIVLEGLRTGMSVTDACTIAGVGRSTFYVWKKEVDYAAQIERSEVECKRHMVKIVMRAAEKDPRWAAWFLERRYPTEYGRVPLRPVSTTVEAYMLPEEGP